MLSLPRKSAGLTDRESLSESFKPVGVTVLVNAPREDVAEHHH